MAIETERKFLVKGDAWKRDCIRKERLRDGLISFSPERKVRVRIGDSRATLTIKAKQAGIQDREFEYDIPLADAEELLASHCGEYVLAKTRHYVPHDGRVWEVDVYEGLLAGVVLAEIEVDDENMPISRPDWVGIEVTGRPEYKKINMQRAALANMSRRAAG